MQYLIWFGQSKIIFKNITLNYPKLRLILMVRKIISPKHTMKKSEDNNDEYENEIFGIPNINKDFKNRRIAVRYIRSDIKISFIQTGLFKSSKQYDAELLDISSKGIAIACKDKLPINQKVTIHLTFSDKKKFSIKSRVVYQSDIIMEQYGIKFDQLNNELGDYILASQNNLDFK